jgi:hypothetical protein
MAFTYESAVPWGRSFEDYVQMFALTNADLERSILSCADGPAAFNAKMIQRGIRVVSCDPLYQFSPAQIRKRIDETYENVIEQTHRNVERFVWTRIRSVEELGQVRRAAMDEFLNDLDRGKAEGRYVIAELPDLPFLPRSFDLAVCSHFLFLYSPILTLSFHINAVAAMCAVAREVRIFPLLTYDGEPSPYLEQIVESVCLTGRTANIERVPYEFQRGGNEMLRILSRS